MTMRPIASEMPKVDLDQLRETLTPIEFSIARRVLDTSGQNIGSIRSRKPFGDRDASYVWKQLTNPTTENPNPWLDQLVGKIRTEMIQ